jgi:predicted cobalt transporter CbtA
MLSARSFLVRGLVAGLLAGIAAFVVAYLVGEPSVNAAIALEGTGHAATEPGHHASGQALPGEPVVPRSLQSTAGLLTGTVVAGVTLGGLVGVLSALALGRFGALGVRATTLAVTAAGFLVVIAVPTLGYPPNPPAVGNPGTIGLRTTLYFLLVAISVLAAVAAVLAGRALAPRLGGWYATLAAGAGYVAVTLTALALLPSFSEVPPGYPATVLYEFRRASFLTQLTLWTVLGVVLADLAQRLTAPVRVPRRQPRSGVLP